MKKMIKTNSILFFISVVCFLYNVFVYSYLRSNLTPTLQEPTAKMIHLGNIVVISLFVLGIYHLFILVQILKSLPSFGNSWLQSIFLVFLMLSGITLLSDVTLLSEIGKEYRFWDVMGEWNMIFGFTVFHAIILLIGYFLVQKTPIRSEKIFKTLNIHQDIWFLSLNHIGVICGVLGLIAFVLSLTLPILERFRESLLMVFSILAAFPWIAFMVYWFIKNRGKSPAHWLDEKQMQDSATAAFFTLLISMPLLVISIFFTNSSLITLNTTFWLALLFFIQLGVFSIVVSVRSKFG